MVIYIRVNHLVRHTSSAVAAREEGLEKRDFACLPAYRGDHYSDVSPPLFSAHDASLHSVKGYHLLTDVQYSTVQYSTVQCISSSSLLWAFLLRSQVNRSATISRKKIATNKFSALTSSNMSEDKPQNYCFIITSTVHFDLLTTLFHFIQHCAVWCYFCT